MSRSFHFQFKDISAILKNTPIREQLTIGGIALGCNLCYAIGTKKEADIIISKKYKFDRNGFTEFMVIDDKGQHYNINNSFWYWKWNSNEDWHRIKIHSVIHSKYYGLRIPFLGLFPNIVSTIDPTFDKNEAKAEPSYTHFLKNSKGTSIAEQTPII